MSTDLTTTIPEISSTEIAVFQAGNAMRDVMASNFEEGDSMSFSQLPKATIPMAGSPWSYKAGGQMKSTDAIEGVLVFRGMSVTLWPSEDSSGGSVPFIVSCDGVTGYQRGDDLGDLDEGIIEEARIGDGEYDMRKMVYTKWSKDGGRNIPPRAKEYRHLAILPKAGLYPIHVALPSTSIGVIKDFIRRLEVPFYRCVVKLGLDEVKSRDGKRSYQVVSPSVVETLSEEEGEAVKSAYMEPLKASFRDMVLGTNR